MFASPAEALQQCPPPAAHWALALPDGTRPVHLPPALQALREHLSGDPVAVIGLGLHRPMQSHELPDSPFRLLQHDPDDCVSTRTIDGIPGAISRHLVGAEAILSVGIVELHQYAGFSGGHKGVAVGCGGRATLDALHHRDRVTAPGVAIGRLLGNPFREAVDALGAAGNCQYVLLQAGDFWFAGPPIPTLHAAAASLDCWFHLPRAYTSAVLEVPAQKAVNFYQASRAATYVGLSAAPPLLLGATLYLEAACPEGLGQGSGEAAFARVLASMPAPWEGLLTGPAPVGAGTQRAVMLALLLQRFRLVICGVQDPAPFQALGLEASRLPARALAPSDALWLADPFHRLPLLVPA